MYARHQRLRLYAMATARRFLYRAKEEMVQAITVRHARGEPSANPLAPPYDNKYDAVVTLVMVIAYTQERNATTSKTKR